MRKILLAILFMACAVTSAQKKANGTIYIDHPAITVVENMTKAFVSGDTKKLTTYLADDFKAFNGASVDSNDKGSDKESFLKEAAYWKDNVDYFNIGRSPGAYPDALEYLDENQKNVTWVQTWDDITGVDKKTGVKIDMPLHRLFVVNKDNKITRAIGYSNASRFMEVRDSQTDRKNGEIYNHHEYINSVRKMVYAFEHKDFTKAYSFYDEKAVFINNNEPDGTSHTLAEQKELDKKLFESFNLLGIDVTGYPDYLHYELGNQDVVQSWWTFRLERKSDKKLISLPIFFIDNFNDKGKITSEIMYYGEKLLEAPIEKPVAAGGK